mgnify:CR=1 FL=1
MLASLLLIVGGVNWGLVGVAMLMGNGANWNVVNLLLGSWPMVEAIVYVLVGLAGVWAVISYKACCAGMCTKK